MISLLVPLRFALQEVKEPSDNNRRKAEPVLLPMGADLKKAESSSKQEVRYVDGMPVYTRKGEKYVVENLKEEWDGGSRGKVKTKGKRGKGFA